MANLGVNLALSPDGSRIVYRGQTQLLQRSIGQLEIGQIPGTEEARNPVLSPDGNSLAFTGGGSLKTVSLLGGPPFTVVTSGVPDGGGGLDWGSDGMLYFTNNEGAIQRVPASGGEPEPVTTNDPGTSHMWVEALPEGRGLMFTITRGGPDQSEIAVVGFGDEELRTLLPGAMARYASSGHIVYTASDGTLLAAPFDLRQLEVTGPSLGLFEGVDVYSGSASQFALSETGTLLWWGSRRAYDASGGRSLLVVDLEGNENPLVLAPRDIDAVRWSPDGQSVVYGGISEGDIDEDIYTYNVELGTTPRQLTFEGRNLLPVFSPDGNRVAFMSLRAGTDTFDVFVKTLDDDEPARSIITLPFSQVPMQWPSDTLIVLRQLLGPVSAGDLWMLNLADPDNAVAVEYLSSEADLRDIKVSPDGTLAAYTSDETGTREIYVRSFPDPGKRTPVSQGRGELPFWSPDGSTVYYWAVSGRRTDTFMAAHIERNPTPVVLSRDSLFTGVYVRAASDLHPVGDRVIVARLAGVSRIPEGAAAEAERFIVVTNWFEELKERVPN